MRNVGGKKQASKRKRTYNKRLIRATWPYSIQEIAALFKVHKNTPLRWLGEGLRANGDGRPYLIRGDELIRFIVERQESKKHQCKPHEFFCFKCRSPREAHLNIVDVIIENSIRLRVKGSCAECRTQMCKVQGIKKLPEIRNRFHIQQPEGQRIIDSDEPSVNSDLEIKYEPA